MTQPFRLKKQVAEPLRRHPRGTILNAQGKPVTMIQAPAGSAPMASRLERLNAWRESYNPLRGLTISKVVRLLEDYNQGRMADLQWAFFHIEQTDPDLIALLALRIGRIVEMDYNLTPEQDGDEALAAEQAEFLGEKLAAIDNLYEGIEHLAMAPFRGYAHVEKHTDAAGEVVHLEPVDQWNVVRDGMRGPWKYNPTARSADFLGLGDGVPVLPMERFLYRASHRPINRFALLKFVRSGLADKDWDAFNEIYNVPGGVVIGPPDVQEDDEIAYEQAAQRVAEGGSGYLPHGSDFKPHAMPHDPKTFRERLDYLSEKLVLAGTGGKLTMLTEAGSGTLAGGAHSDVFDKIASAEAWRISEVINRGLISGWLDAAFPGQPHVCYFQLAAMEETNSAAAVEQVAQLSAAGFQLDPEQVAQKTGWSVTLKPAPATPPAAGEDDAADEERVTNRASSAVDLARQARFEANADRLVLDGERAALAPLIAALGPVLAAGDDDAAFTAAWRAFQAQLPELEKAILTAHPEMEQALDDVLATAMANGLVDGAESRGVIDAGDAGRIANMAPRHGNTEWEEGRQPRAANGEFGRKGGASLSKIRGQMRERVVRAVMEAQRRRGEVHNVVEIRGLGQVSIGLGSSGDKSRDFRGGWGAAHWQGKHRESTAAAVADLLVRGRVVPSSGGDVFKRELHLGDWRGILADKGNRTWRLISVYREGKR